MYILFDIGGTKTRVAATKTLGEIGKVVKFDTPTSFVEGVAAIKKAALELAGGEVITAAAGGIRGPLSPDHTTIVHEIVLTDWVEKPIAKELSEAFGGCPVYLENDAALVGLGEAHFGAGKGYDIVAYHTVSTGVGGARIVHGEIDAQNGSFEPGHQIIDADATLLDPSRSDTLEELVSGAALEKRFGKKPYDIPQSDPVWGELARFLAYGLKNTIAYWSPDVIVLGGSMIVGDPRILLSDIIFETKKVLGSELQVPKIVDATLKDEGGLYGALIILKKREEQGM